MKEMSDVSPVHGSPSPGPEPGERLDSWKEIAAYLKRDISTVQRWEKKEGLPVHRLPHDKMGSMFAFKPELDAWLNRGLRRAEAVPATSDGPSSQQEVSPIGVAARARLHPDGPRSSSRVVLIGSAAVVLAFLTGAAAAWVASASRGATAEVKTLAPEIRFVVNNPPVTTNSGPRAGDAPIAVARDGSVLVYVATENGVQRLYQRRLGNAVAAPIAGTEGAQTPFLSPDGRWVGFTVFAGTGTGARLQKVALAGGEPVTICELAGSRGASWGSDGTIIFAPHPDSGLWQVPDTGGVAQVLTRPDPDKGERSHRWPFFIPDRRLVLYTIAKSDIASFDDAVIAIRDLDTGRDTELVRGGSYPMYVEATGQLVFARAGTLLTSPLDLTRRAVREPPSTVLTDVLTYPITGAAAAAISNTGVLISAPGGPAATPSTTVLRVDRQGKSEPISFPRALMSGARVSPDQRMIAMEIDGANNAIWIGDLRRATTARLTPQWTHWSPVWSPDGTQIAFTSGRGGGRNLFVQRIDRPEEAERLTTSDGTNLVTSWSSDGRYLAYDDQAATTARDIAVFDLKDRKPIPLVHSPADEYSGRFSPDAKFLAYVSNDSGRPEVYLQAFPQSTFKTAVSPGDGGTNPVWARDGRELYYRNGDALMAVSVRTGPVLAVGSPRLLFRKRTFNNDFDVTADGHFLMVETSDAPSAMPFTVIVNWLGIGLVR